MVVLIGMTFLKIILAFYSSRIAKVNNRLETSIKEKGYRKEYFNFQFLSEENKKDSFYSNHQMILTLVKDPLLSVFLVFLSEIPAVQIGGAFVISLLFFLLEYIYKPSKLDSENKRNTISMGIYTLTNLFFLGLHFIGEGSSKATREYFFGIPLIILVSSLIISNYYISLSVTIKALKEKCSKKKV